MSLIHLEKQGDHWRSRVEGRFHLGAHPIETTRKGLPEAMAQAIVDHCAMSGEDVEQFTAQVVREINALATVEAELSYPDELDGSNSAWREDAPPIEVTMPAEPRKKRAPRKAARAAPGEPVVAPKEDI